MFWGRWYLQCLIKSKKIRVAENSRTGSERREYGKQSVNGLINQCEIFDFLFQKKMRNH
jgi:hypothetical protein